MPAIPPYKTKTIGDCTLILGDCLEYIPTLPWHSVDMLLTDPPYGILHKTNFRVVSDTPEVIAGDECLAAFDRMAQAMSGKLAGDASVYCFCSPKNIDGVLPIARKLWNVKNILIWDKENWGAGDLTNSYGFQYEMIIYASKSNRALTKRTGDVLRVSRIHVANQTHQHQKPDKLLSYLIENSTSEGDLVIDPFMGSARVGVCCARLNRRFIGCEIDPVFYRQSVASISLEYLKMRHGDTAINSLSDNYQPLEEFDGGAEL